MSQSTLVIILAAVCFVVLIILFGGVLLGHNGLFEVGAELAKYVFSAVAGALVSLIAKN